MPEVKDELLEYNGSIEAGIGSLKTRMERYASWAGHPGYWTCTDVAAAQTEANATASPQGGTGPTSCWRTTIRDTHG